MAICANDTGNITGRAVQLFLADGCADTVPDDSEFLYLGPMTSKGIDFSPSTVTSEADDSDGFVATLVTTADLTISADFEVRAMDKSDEYGIHKLIKYFTDELKARRQPSLWARHVMGATITTGYFNITALSADGGTNDLVTGSIELKPADGDTINVFSVEDLTLTTDVPSTATAATGATLTIGPVVAAGGVTPYTYVWRKGGVIVSGQTSAALSIPSAVSGDAGTYTVTVTDSTTPTPDSIVSGNCVVTIS